LVLTLAILVSCQEGIFKIRRALILLLEVIFIFSRSFAVAIKDCSIRSGSFPLWELPRTRTLENKYNFHIIN